MLSFDNGKSWTKELDLAAGEGEYSHPTVICGADRLHIAFTYRRKSVMYAQVSFCVTDEKESAAAPARWGTATVFVYERICSFSFSFRMRMTAASKSGIGIVPFKTDFRTASIPLT